MFSTRAGLGFDGTPGTGSPTAQRIASTMSDVKPPHFPSTRTGRILLTQLIPATPVALLLAAPMVPATCVPWKVLFVAPQPAKNPAAFSADVTQSPASAAFESRPS